MPATNYLDLNKQANRYDDPGWLKFNLAALKTSFEVLTYISCKKIIVYLNLYRNITI